MEDAFFKYNYTKIRREAVLETMGTLVGRSCKTLDHDLSRLRDMKSLMSKDAEVKIFRSDADWQFLVDVKFSKMCQRILGKQVYDCIKRTFSVSINDDVHEVIVHPKYMYAFVGLTGFNSVDPDHQYEEK